MHVLFFMVISGNMLSQLSVIETLNGSNYGSWRETIKIVLALWEIDLALTTDVPKEPVIHHGESIEAFVSRQLYFVPIRMRRSGLRHFPRDYYKSSPWWFVVGGTKALVHTSRMNTRVYVVHVARA
jgi:hypothetical protein